MTFQPNIRPYKNQLLYTFLTILLYAYFAYFLKRTDYVQLIVLYTGLFFLFYKLAFNKTSDFNFLVLISFAFRIVFLFSIPNLSQDFYRFIWDGRLILEGLNPYLSLPQTFIEQQSYPIHQATELYEGMGTLNGSHYTNYPPINQLCFYIAALFSGKNILGSVIVMRMLIILADLGILFFGKKLLQKLELPMHHIFWYLLNPFIIIELTGNLHFESVMIFFLVWSLYLLSNNKWKIAAVVFALSVSVKLIPLLFLPLFYQWFVKKEDSYLKGIKRLISFYAFVFITIVLLFLPFYSTQLIDNYFNSIGLWFRNFEFNASIYYIFREIGYLFRGWNEIAIIGKIISVLVVLFVLILTFFRNNKTISRLFISMLLALSFYYFMATTVHPWYIAMLLAISIFTNYKFPLIWSFIIILSYLAYANSSYTENLWIIALEYLIVYTAFIWEVIFDKKTILNALK